MLSIFLTVMTLATVADSARYEANPVEVDPIVVVGQREPVRLSKAVNSSITVTPEALREATEDNILTHLTYSSASISLTSVAGNGFGLSSRGQGKLLIRGLGFSPNRGSLVLIDGRPDIAGLFGHPLPDTYRRAGLYSAEVVKGGASTLYGSNAIAGVLDLHSFYRPDLERYTNIELNGGSYNTVNSIIQHSRKVGKAILAGWYEYIESDNHRDNNEYFNRSGGIRAQLNELRGFNLFVAGRFTSFSFADAGPVYNSSRATGDIMRTGVTIGLDRNTRRYSMSARLYNSYGEHRFSDGFNSVDRNNGVDLFAKVRQVGYAGLSLSGGLSFNYLGGSANNGTTFINAGDFQEKEYAAHLQAELTLSETIELTAGGRLIDHDRYDDHFVYQLGAVVSPEGYGSFKLSAGTAYRNPTISETQLFMISNSETLKPEDGSFYEIGYFNRLSANLSVETAVFWREGDNLILSLSNPTPPPMVKYQNSGSYRHSGWEATLRYTGGRWTLVPSFAHLNQNDYNLCVPEDKLVINGSYHAAPLRVSFETIAAFRTASDSSGVPVTLNDYLLVNLDNRFEISETVSLSLRVENLFDKKYAVVFGYPMPGITFRGGMAIKLY